MLTRLALVGAVVVDGVTAGAASANAVSNETTLITVIGTLLAGLGVALFADRLKKRGDRRIVEASDHDRLVRLEMRMRGVQRDLHYLVRPDAPLPPDLQLDDDSLDGE